ncbi:hypothetical protein [Algibacillus agarilyticus]|uniref:hypothetical protein n=1 Tax=Algibacillus agarilyticus TaxID=2234133 RepID=UPI000DD01906|nr:hypothetical protein [Algibacillus agarilyticus]
MFNVVFLVVSVLINGAVYATMVEVNARNVVEQHDIVVVEAEAFATQHLDDKRRWHIFSAQSKPHNYPDGDRVHADNASAGQYIELLPDTRVNHHETLVRGENFSDKPGQIAVLSYPVYFKTPGVYYVWARSYSSGSEDNGVHFGINGTWPSSGQRLQLCQGKHQWTWSSAQRTKTNHCGEPNTVTLKVPTAGVHNIMVSMREDGFELDKFLLTRDKHYQPDGVDRAATIATANPLPIKTQYKGIHQYKRIISAVDDFKIVTKTDPNFVRHDAQAALAINLVKPEQFNQYAYAEFTVGKKDTGHLALTLVTVAEGKGESKGEAHYQVWLNNQLLAEFVNLNIIKSNQETYFKIKPVQLNKGDVIKVAAKVVTKNDTPTTDPALYPKGLWRALVTSHP